MKPKPRVPLSRAGRTAPGAVPASVAAPADPAAPASPASPVSRPASGIGVVAIDLDGTLLNDSKQVSRRTVRALAALPETGRLFRPHKVAPLDEFCTEPVTKVLLLGPPEIIEALKTLMRAAYPTASVIHSDPELLQVMHHAASKASALRRVAEHYGVEMQ